MRFDGWLLQSIMKTILTRSFAQQADSRHSQLMISLRRLVGLTNNTGTSVVSYTYDAWGKILTITGSKASTIGKLNPLRYRGYVYDTETGLYYLGSRYYDPGVGRFINVDEYVTTQQGFIGYCLFAYCKNNPVSNLDSKGKDTVGVFFGFNAAFFIIGGSASIGFVVDDCGNYDFQYSYVDFDDSETYIYGLPCAGLETTIQWTKADTVYDLYGLSLITGGSASIPPFTYGVDAVFLEDWDDPQKTPDGYQLIFGKGFGSVEYHVAKVKTISIKSYIDPYVNAMYNLESIIKKKRSENSKHHIIGKKDLIY